MFLSRELLGGCLPQIFQLKATHTPWLMVPFHLQSQQWLVKSFSQGHSDMTLTLRPPSPTFKSPVIIWGPLDNLLMSWSAD